MLFVGFDHMPKAASFYRSVLWATLVVTSVPGGFAQDRTMQKLENIVIENHHLDGSPKSNVKQLNTLARKYDLPTHQGVLIKFDPAVDSESCTTTSRQETKSLGRWLQDVCDVCGSRYRIDGSTVVIELLPISEKETPNLEAFLTNGIVELCREFRSRRGQDRLALAEKIFRLLPHSPVTSSKEIGSGTIVTYDYGNPNYKLYKRDVLLLLGKPDRNVNNELFCYAVRPAGVRSGELSVEFGKYEYAINPGLHWK
jgi:hypothetical protein